MKYFAFLLLLIPASAQTLHYTVNWPSGLSLGEATLTASGKFEQISTASHEHWDFDLSIDASVPGFAVRDHYHSTAGNDLCSIQLDKTVAHGSHKAQERITFDQEKTTVTRESLNGGGKSEVSVSSCARDALSFLQFARRELAQGRLVPQQQVVLGALYQVRLEYTGQQKIKVGEEQIDADRIVATVKGPSSDLTVEMFFSRDPARTPVLARVPVPIGTLTVERVR